MDSVHSDMHHIRRDGGVEEKKVDDLLDEPQHDSTDKDNPHVAANESIDHGEGGARNFQEQLQQIARSVLGGCGSAMEAVTFFVQDCRWPLHMPPDDQGYMNGAHDPMQHRSQQHYTRTPAPPLSIAQELQKLAAQTPKPSVRSTDIPKFLGEEAVYPFEDDNISCLSQHTLEEMAIRGGLQHHPNTVYYNRNGVHRTMADLPSPGEVSSRRRLANSMSLNQSQSSASRTSLEDEFT